MTSICLIPLIIVEINGWELSSISFTRCAYFVRHEIWAFLGRRRLGAFTALAGVAHPQMLRVSDGLGSDARRGSLSPPTTTAL